MMRVCLILRRKAHEQVTVDRSQMGNRGWTRIHADGNDAPV